MGGCCYSNEGLIGITNSSREIMLVEPSTGMIDTFGKMKVGTFKWTGGCEYKGKCYGFPRKENSLLVIDYKNREAYTHKLNSSYRGEHHYGGVLIPNGMIYQPPRNTNHVLKINLNTYETDRIYMPRIKDQRVLFSDRCT